MLRRVCVVLGGNPRRLPAAAQTISNRSAPIARGGSLSKPVVLQAPQSTVSQAKNIAAPKAKIIKPIAKAPKATAQAKKPSNKPSPALKAEAQKKTLKTAQRTQSTKGPTVKKGAKLGSQNSKEKKAKNERRPHAHAVQKIKYNKRVAAIAKLWRLGKKKTPRSSTKSNTSK